MVLFKEIKKTSASDTRNTLYSKIDAKIEHFINERENVLPKLKKTERVMHKKIRRHSKKPKNNAEFWEEHWEMLDVYDDITSEIKRIQYGNEYHDYLLDIIPYIQLYAQEESKTDSASDIHYRHVCKKMDKKLNTSAFSNFVNITGNVSKGDIYKRYMQEVEKDFTHVFDVKNEADVCPDCDGDIELQIDDYEVKCNQCGYSKPFMDSSLKFTSYQQDFEIVNYIAYKRINHFNEWLSQFQGNESTVVPQEVFDKLALEFKKIRVTSSDSVKPDKIREFLKKLKLNKYYEHIPYIMRVLQGKKPPSLTYTMENTLRKMFIDIQDPFAKACPKSRKNFLSYSYVIHKFCELLEYDEFLESFPLLKSREKLYQQDVIWKSICKELKWEFIPSL